MSEVNALFSDRNNMTNKQTRLGPKFFKKFFLLKKIQIYIGMFTLAANKEDYHALIKNKDKKEFNVKIFERETSPTGVWVFFEDGSQEICNILVGADGINSPIRKQKLPELQIVDYGITHVSADVSVSQHLMDKANKIHGNFLVRNTLGTKRDSTLMMTRLIPIKQEQNDEKSEPHYRVTLFYSYPSELDNV
ncbi:hypothetical protein C1646_663936 [Rhizophagus diaphanus]|nr:hypothetical protein C1646_663936 [Rhizophagus diaphanus] [Rhizophagus sp. MUCL 43196]